MEVTNETVAMCRAAAIPPCPDTAKAEQEALIRAAGKRADLCAKAIENDALDAKEYTSPPFDYLDLAEAIQYWSVPPPTHADPLGIAPASRPASSLLASIQTAPAVRRQLEWAGKTFEVAPCSECKKTRALLAGVCHTCNVKITDEARTNESYSLDVIEWAEKKIAELHAAMFGGVYTVPKLESQ